MSALTEAPNRVAIIGMAGRFPGAPDVETFWQNLAAGRESIATLSEPELIDAGVSSALLHQPNYVRAKGVLDGGDLFDAGFFGLSPREAEIMDPQHRVFLECAWAALESAGCDPTTFRGRIGLFGGASLNTYLLFNLAANPAAVASAGEFQTLIANDKDFLATRVSYQLDLRGPSVTVQTACSTSLTAVHLACQSLLNGECDIALAGGVSVTVPLRNGYLYERGGIVSPDGHCRAFDAAASGTVAGNGVGIVVLRRLADAQQSGDAIAAIIRATAINNDGSVKVGYTAPSVDGQAEVIAEALAVSEVDPATIGYVETHGTATALGDPIEIAALTRAYREHTQEKGFCAIGSVKSNIGHLDAAAGVTGLIKATLALRHEAIPPTLNFERANPELGLDTSPFFVNTQLRPWPRGPQPRRAGVSSFGIGGTNVHVILEEAPAPGGAAPIDPAGAHLLALSARTPAALAAGAGRLAEYLQRHPDADLGDVGATLACRRTAFECRRAVVVHDRAEAIAALGRLAQDATAAPVGGDTPVAFLFPGQGSQYVHMAAGLYRHEPVFARELDRCADLFAGHLGLDLRTLLYPTPDQTDSAARALAQTAITQPVIFAVGYALAELWRSWGVRPRVMVGHSIGEYVAACLAGVFSLPDAVRLVAARGRLVQAMPRGAMLAVFLPEPEAAGWLTDDLCVAAVNSTALTVVSGAVPAVDELQHRLAAAGVAHRRLHTSHAFHSPSMTGAVAPFVAEVATTSLKPPQIPFCSNVTGTWITDEQATSPAYWGSQLRQPVRFGDALELLLADTDLALLEVGPGETLRSFVLGHRAWREGRTVAGSLHHPSDQRDDDEYLSGSVGSLWCAGVSIDWAARYGDRRRQPLPLPHYAFQRLRYWVDPQRTGDTAALTGSAPGPSTGLFFVPGWRRLPPRSAPVDRDAVWLVLGADLPLGAELVRQLAADGADVVAVSAGHELHRAADSAWTLNPASRDHCAELLRTITARAKALHIAHLWSLRGGTDDDPAGAWLDPDGLDRARRCGFDTLLALGQGIGDLAEPIPIALDVLGHGWHCVTGDERLRPEHAPLLGPSMVIPQEVPAVSCRTLDITGVDLEHPGRDAVRAVRDVLGQSTADSELALRGNYWWVRDFDAVPVADGPDAPRLRDGGVYLITGGLGGIGLALAQSIVDHCAHPVLGLLSRSGLPHESTWADRLAAGEGADGVGAEAETRRRIRAVMRLRDRGATVAVLTADVTDEAQTRRVVDDLRDRHGPVHGVIHAAGRPSRGLIMTKSTADAEQVFAAKTRGTLVLDQIFAGTDLDFLLLCSSLTAVLGGPGQSDYAGANAFLDLYAQWRRQQTGTPVTSIGWDTWRDVGMATGLAARLRRGAGAELTGHPLLRRLVKVGDGARTYATTFTTADSWIVDEHRVMGHGLVPGTAYLELVRAIMQPEAEGRDIELTDVLFTLPVIVPDGQTREVYTTVERGESGWRFAVRSRIGAAGGPADWQEHASGMVTVRDPDTGARRDIDEVRRRCGPVEVLETEEALKHRLKLGEVEEGGRIRFTFGPRWRRSLRRIEAGAGRMLVRLSLDDAYRSDLDSYGLHPALLDLAGAAARIHAPDVYYMPLAYRSLRVSSGLTSTTYCAIDIHDTTDSSGETLTCDIDILDPDGRILVRIRDFTIKRINDVDAMLSQIDRAALAPAEPDDAGALDGALATLSSGISRATAVTAFTRLLTAGSLPDWLLVSGQDLPAMRRVARTITPASLTQEVERIAPLRGTHPRPDLATAFVAPVTEAEQGVAAIWREVLGIEEVGTQDDFFALGGHSLAAVQIGAKIKHRFGVDLELRSFFDRPTIASTVAALSARPAAADGAETIPVLRRNQAGGDTSAGAELDGLSDDEVDAALRALIASATDEPGVTA